MKRTTVVILFIVLIVLASYGVYSIFVNVHMPPPISSSDETRFSSQIFLKMAGWLVRMLR